MATILKLVIAARTHEHPQVIRAQDGVADHVVVETQVEGDAAPGLS